eukprot:COSAG06_NODE_508_length_14925_cov_18.648995_2_plen_297_part_00
MIQDGQTHDFVFAAQSGMRYDVDVRVANGGQEPCSSSNLYGESTVAVAGLACHPTLVFTAQPAQLNGKPHYRSDDGQYYLYWSPVHEGRWLIDHDEDDSGYAAHIPSVADTPPAGLVQGREHCDGSWADVAITVVRPLQTAGDCDSLVSSRTLSCGTDLAEGGEYAHYCDRTCGFLCTEDGVTSTDFWVLPPGATDTSQAVASQTTSAAADKGLGFTAAATGDFTARVIAYGSGPVTLTATAVGTAEHRSPPLRADGRPHPLEVSCTMNRCAFGYDGASAYDGDGSGFDLVRDCLY